MPRSRRVPYGTLLRPSFPQEEIPQELRPDDEASRLLCRACARTMPRGDGAGVVLPFTRVLIATDGSPVSTRAVAFGVALARLAAARVVFLHAAMPWRGGHWLARLVAASDAAVDPGALALAESSLDYARATASNAGVRFDTRLAYDPHPDRAIVDAVRSLGCDLVVMGSRTGQLARRVGAVLRVPLVTCRDGED